jgi:hypothetical protein
MILISSSVRGLRFGILGAGDFEREGGGVDENVEVFFVSIDDVNCG